MPREMVCPHCRKMVPVPEYRFSEDIPLTDAEKRALRLAEKGFLKRVGNSAYWTVGGLPIEKLTEYNSAHTRTVNRLTRLRLLVSENRGVYNKRSITEKGLRRLDGRMVSTDAG